jgi:hypothetical protein
MEEKGEYSQMVQQPMINFQKVYDSMRKEVPYKIRTEFGTPMKSDSIIKICSNETHSSLYSNNLSDSFPIQNVFKKGDAL